MKITWVKFWLLSAAILILIIAFLAVRSFYFESWAEKAERIDPQEVEALAAHIKELVGRARDLHFECETRKHSPLSRCAEVLEESLTSLDPVTAEALRGIEDKELRYKATRIAIDRRIVLAEEKSLENFKTLMRGYFDLEKQRSEAVEPVRRKLIEDAKKK
jgi:hypothetical protein